MTHKRKPHKSPYRIRKNVEGNFYIEYDRGRGYSPIALRGQYQTKERAEKRRKELIRNPQERGF